MGSHKKHRKHASSSSDDSEDEKRDRKKKKRSHSESSSKKKRRKRKRSTSSSESSSSPSPSSSSSSESEQERRRLKKQKKLKRLQKKQKKQKKEDQSTDIPLDLMEKSKAMAPMTKEEWEKRQNVVRRVYDESTGRHRLIKGDGEVIEEIVSRDRHKAINQQATQGDGDYFQSRMAARLNK